jgi:hypothetical protein
MLLLGLPTAVKQSTMAHRVRDSMGVTIILLFGWLGHVAWDMLDITPVRSHGCDAGPFDEAFVALGLHIELLSEGWHGHNKWFRSCFGGMIQISVCCQCLS